MNKNSCADRLKSIDIFSEKVTLNYDGAKSQFQTVSGAIFSFIMLLIILGYGTWKMAVMVQLQEYSIKESFDWDRFGEKYTFESSGFHIAFGMHTKSTSEEEGSFEDYGTVEANYLIWDEDKTKFEKMETRPCTDEDLKTNFFPAGNE